MAKVHLDSVLAEFVPGRHLSSRAESLGALLDDLERRYPKLRFRIRDETGALRRFIKLFVNGTEAVGPDLAGTALGPADEVDVIHSVQGGRRRSAPPRASRSGASIPSDRLRVSLPIGRQGTMADRTVRVYLGTRKGGYVVESDRRRRKWAVRGPFQPGKDVFHVAPDPRRPGTVYSAANSPFVGPMLFRSGDHGRKWTELAPPMMTLAKERPNPFESPGPPHYPIVNLWHIEPGPLGEPKTVFLGVDPAGLYRSDDGGASWSSVRGLNEHETRAKWNPGAGGMCLHTILLDPTRPGRMYVGISAAGMFRSEDSGEHWTPANGGVAVSFLPDKHPQVGQCVHKVALDPARPETAYRQDHDGIYVSHDSMESWKRVGRPLESDFGFVVAVARSRPGQAYFVPLDQRTRTAFARGPEVYRWTEKGRDWAATIRGRLASGDVGTHREGLAIDGLDPPGIYLGTTTGQLLVSPDGDRSWLEVPYLFPAIHSVSVDTPEALVG